MRIVSPSRQWSVDCSSCENTDWGFTRDKWPAVGGTVDRYLCSMADNSNLDSAKKKEGLSEFASQKHT